MPTITTGKISGLEDDGVAVFKGIPYAKSPFGALRFAAPEPADPWEGTFEATRFGPPPPQPAMLPGQRPWDPAGGLDVLTVNVWTPDAGGSGLPVMVWLYGGAYWMGAADWPEYDGARLARHGVVVVTLNYRVGVEGFGQIDGAPANRGLLDQVEALRWVRENIAAFGGDPGNVTIFGESAGAGSVAALLVMPSAAGLFRRAIAQSVPGPFLSPGLASRVTGAVMARLGGGSPYETTPEALVAASAAFAREDLVRERGRWGQLAYVGMPVAPVVDGEVLPDTPWNALAAGAGADVELIAGYNRDEFLTFHAMRGEPPNLAGVLKALAPDGADAVYRSALPEASDEDLYVRVMSDWLFRMPSTLLADAHPGPAYVYELTWAPTPMLGACHGLDVPLVFGATRGEMAGMMTGGSPDLEPMSEQFRTAWTRFAATGDPGWPRYEPTAATTHLFDVEPSDVDDPEAASRALWSKTGVTVVD
ncbi:carboxylesterase/lipase family protein [Nonomuraea sp. SBT364]|uniref:carboxylesterase/lipase family protein n=1 Tax=Nonomuraea sp. SBT364 TaxID=1580530 RepID=UPI00066E13AC|nr:carboxylesterase family protein [Nonomuraea sp. SBT364]